LKQPLVVKSEFTIEAGGHAGEQRIVSRRTTGSAKADSVGLCPGYVAGMSQSRRLAGILAADVVGYSAKIGTDEPYTLARVRALRTDLIEPLATSHGGRLFKTTGDGFLAAFTSSVEALRCAIAIQERLRAQPDGLRLRIACIKARWSQKATILSAMA
jgi:class 3 adenylate cyclase